MIGTLANFRLLQLAQSGRSERITAFEAKRGQPVARLVAARDPAARATRRAAGPSGSRPDDPAGILDWLRDNPLPAYARRSAADIAAERDSRD